MSLPPPPVVATIAFFFVLHCSYAGEGPKIQGFYFCLYNKIVSAAAQ